MWAVRVHCKERRFLGICEKLVTLEMLKNGVRKLSQDFSVMSFEWKMKFENIALILKGTIVNSIEA
jgi:hypothetical protein